MLTLTVSTKYIGVHWCPLVSTGVRWCPLVFAGVRWCPLGSAEVHWGLTCLSGSVGVHWYPSGLVRDHQGPLLAVRTRRGLGTVWGSSEVHWDHSGGLFGVSWGLLVNRGQRNWNIFHFENFQDLVAFWNNWWIVRLQVLPNLTSHLIQFGLWKEVMPW